jgi:tetratricopeptide (TPR) repeat protein
VNTTLNRIPRWFPAAMIVAVTVALYAPVIRYGFVSLDDPLLITENPIVQHVSVSSVWKAFTSYDPELYIPVTILSYQIEHVIVGNAAWLAHVDNVLLHILNAILVAAVIGAITHQRWIGYVCGLLFAIHPLSVETVAWAAARKDLLATTFGLVSLRGWLTWRATGEKRSYYKSLLAFAIALASKVTVVTHPLILLLLTDRERRRWDRAVLREVWPFFALSLFFGIIAIGGKTDVLAASSFFQNILLVFKSTIVTLGSIIAPRSLTVLVPQATPVTLASTEFLFPIIACVMIVALIIWSRKWTRDVTLGMGWFLLFLVPNFTNFTKNGFLYVTSDRYAYLPMIGVFLLMLIGLLAVARKSRNAMIPFFLIFAAWCGMLAWRTVQELPAWANGEALYRDVIATYHGDPLAHNNLGTELLRTGKTDEALAEYRTAARSDAHFVLPRVNIAGIQRERGDIDGAIAAYNDGIAAISGSGALRRDDLLPFFALADLLKERGKIVDAFAMLDAAVERGKDLPEPHWHLALACLDVEDTECAQKELERVVALEPSFTDAHYRLASLYGARGMLQEAAEQLRIVLRQDPMNEDAARHLANIEQMLSR